jgi:uncharacterized protein YcnI
VINRSILRLAGGIVSASLLILAAALPAAAHITIPDGSSVAAGRSAVIHFRVPHGCDGAATTAVALQLPDGVVGAKPQQMAGWTATTTMVPANYTLFGTQYTERVGTIRWEGGPLADTEFLDFGVSANFQLEPGEYPMSVVQECGTASQAWIEVAAPGQSEDDLEHPAPIITVVAAGEGGDEHMPSNAADLAKLTADLSAASDRIAALEARPSQDTSTPLMIAGVALIAGLAGLGLGAFAVRRRS